MSMRLALIFVIFSLQLQANGIFTLGKAIADAVQRPQKSWGTAAGLWALFRKENEPSLISDDTALDLHREASNSLHQEESIQSLLPRHAKKYDSNRLDQLDELGMIRASLPELSEMSALLAQGQHVQDLVAELPASTESDSIKKVRPLDSKAVMQAGTTCSVSSNAEAVCTGEALVKKIEEQLEKEVGPLLIELYRVGAQLRKNSDDLTAEFSATAASNVVRTETANLSQYLAQEIASLVESGLRRAQSHFITISQPQPYMIRTPFFRLTPNDPLYSSSEA